MTEFRKGVAYSALLVGMLLATGSSSATRDEHSTVRTPAEPCAPDNGGITLPDGFCATVFADKIGHARHLVVSPDGAVYVNTWSGKYYGNDKPPEGGFLVALRDTTGDGVADQVVRFGNTVAKGGTGGTGIALHDGALYAEAHDRIVRYRLSGGFPRADGRRRDDRAEPTAHG